MVPVSLTAFAQEGLSYSKFCSGHAASWSTSATVAAQQLRSRGLISGKFQNSSIFLVTFAYNY